MKNTSNNLKKIEELKKELFKTYQKTLIPFIDNHIWLHSRTDCRNVILNKILNYGISVLIDKGDKFEEEVILFDDFAFGCHINPIEKYGDWDTYGAITINLCI